MSTSSEAVVLALINLIPNLLWFLLVIVLVLLFRKSIKERLLPRVSTLKIFGVEAEFIKEELNKAAQRVPAGDPKSRSRTAHRSERLSAITSGASVLIVNDVPSEMRHVVKMLETLHIDVHVARTTDEALSLLAAQDFHAVISDMSRDGVRDEGLRFLQESRRKGLSRPTIFTVGLCMAN